MIFKTGSALILSLLFSFYAYALQVGNTKEFDHVNVFDSSQTLYGTDSLEKAEAPHQLKDLELDSDGYLANTSGDGYFQLMGLDHSRDRLCGLLLKMEFKNPVEKATLFDVYWRTKSQGYSENQKGFFIINNEHTKTSNTYLVSLCKLHNFSGNLNQSHLQDNISALRLDYPGNKRLAIKFESIQILDDDELQLRLKQADTNDIVLEAYERINPRAFTSLDVIVPKLIFAFEEGLKRLTNDLGFLVFWLLLIIALKLLLLRSFIRQYRSSEEDS